jgi:sortase (surface protein transpeptidase)
MKFLRKDLLILLSVAVVFLSLPNSGIRAQQMTEVQRQTLVAQLAQQIAQLQQQLSQLLAQQQTSPGLPVRLKIPVINVDAVIGPVGLTPSGEVGAPKGPATTSWFDLGPRPGNIGSAVIVGHYGHWKIGVGSVFDNLNKLVRGDKIYVEDENGMTFAFVVRESAIYDSQAKVSSVFYSDDGKAHLNLVTCEGTWIPAQKTFTNRFVVFADKE